VVGAGGVVLVVLGAGWVAGWVGGWVVGGWFLTRLLGIVTPIPKKQKSSVGCCGPLGP
jgi:hypothetical protein